MVLIRYYNLESKSPEDVSNLEKNLKKRLLDEKRIRNCSDTLIKDVAEAREGDQDAVTELIPDSGDFDVLYRKTRTISEEKKRWFKKNIPRRTGIELVVKGVPGDILELQTYLGDSRFELVEVKEVKRAMYTFHSYAKTETCVDAGITVYTSLFLDGEFDLRFNFLKNTGYVCGVNGHALQGSVSGGVEDVLRARKSQTRATTTSGTIHWWHARLRARVARSFKQKQRVFFDLS